jgi:hypothetical protein
MKHAALAAGGALIGSPLVPRAVQAKEAPTDNSPPKRFVFFLISNGLHPSHVRPQELSDSYKTDKLIDTELAPHKLPEWSQPLEKYKDRMTILHGVNGQHCNTSHGSPFGCLAGVKKGKSPIAQTIDHALAQVLPETPLTMLGFGLSQLAMMQNSPINYSSSAAGDSKPLPMFCDPRMAYQNIFGSVAGGKSQESYLSETAWYDQLIDDSARLRKRLSGTEAAKFDTYIDGLRQTKQQRLALLAHKDSLSKFKPEYTEAFDAPQHSGDWWKANIDIGVAALQAGVTNVLTVDAGLSGPDGMPLDTLDLLHKAAGREGKPPGKSHDLGHWSQNRPYWLTTRHYSLELLERIIRPLATTPEPGGQGSMLDNTLIHYTSDSGEVQHSHGIHWSHMLIGNLGGRIQTGRYIQFPTWGGAVKTPAASFGDPVAHKKRPHDGRTINALWTTLLHAAGQPVDDFNLNHAPVGIDRSGPMEELLV